MHDNIRGTRVSQTISITNSESLYYATRDASRQAYIDQARFSLCDGIGVVLAARAEGAVVHRVTGPDLMQACCEYGVAREWRHFFYGGKPAVPELLVRKLTARFPGMITAGTYAPPFRPLSAEEENSVVKMIRSSRADIVWVGLGLPKQEQWISEHWLRLDVPWLIGVGAAFDFHAGTLKRAPLWVRRGGCEWLYRLAREPRMFRRDIRSLVFLLDAVAGAALHTARRPQRTAPAFRTLS